MTPGSAPGLWVCPSGCQVLLGPELAPPLPRVGSPARPRPGGGPVPWAGRCRRSRRGGEERGGRRSRRRGLVKGSATCLRSLFIPPSRESGSSAAAAARAPSAPLPGTGLRVQRAARRSQHVGGQEAEDGRLRVARLPLPSSRGAPNPPGTGVPPSAGGGSRGAEAGAPGGGGGGGGGRGGGKLRAGSAGIPGEPSPRASRNLRAPAWSRPGQTSGACRVGPHQEEGPRLGGVLSSHSFSRPAFSS